MVLVFDFIWFIIRKWKDVTQAALEMKLSHAVMLSEGVRSILRRP